MINSFAIIMFTVVSNLYFFLASVSGLKEKNQQRDDKQEIHDLGILSMLTSRSALLVSVLKSPYVHLFWR